VTLHVTINGTARALDVAPDRRVVDLLREDLGLTGTKEGCGSGECGSCTILVDGEAQLSCLMLAAQLEGRTVTTIEGLAGPDDTLHAIQQAFVDHGAVQCGFCTPGMILAAHDLLTRRPDPTEEDIRTALSGNLCRCTGYAMIVAAVADAARHLRQKAPSP
jgi:aerobic-type carbon monoxide dehydrogenase small subunit (CoxS/CutS family)